MPRKIFHAPENFQEVSCPGKSFMPRKISRRFHAPENLKCPAKHDEIKTLTRNKKYDNL